MNNHNRDSSAAVIIAVAVVVIIGLAAIALLFGALFFVRTKTFEPTPTIVEPVEEVADTPTTEPVQAGSNTENENEKTE